MLLIYIIITQVSVMLENILLFELERKLAFAPVQSELSCEYRGECF
jgi:hypothetical protein